MRLALLSLDSTVGDLAGNAAKIRSAAEPLARTGVPLIVTPELSLLGYPPRDLLLRAGLLEHCMQAARKLAADLARGGAGESAVLVGAPWPCESGAGISNACLVLRSGAVECVYRKRLLPQYDVFDEARYFKAGNQPLCIDVAGQRVGLLLCEDLWRGEDVGEGTYFSDPVGDSVGEGAELLVAMSASPFFAGKHAQRLRVLHAAAQRAGRSIAMVNASGANDDFIFDGGSCLMHPDGSGAFTRPFGDVELVTGLDVHERTPDAAAEVDELARAVVAGIRGYVRKTGHRSVLLGLSGGIDSALLAALAVAALGSDAVRGVSMPSQYSSAGSRSDAIDTAQRLGMRPPDLLPIEDLHALARKHLGVRCDLSGLTDENLQSRLRGLTLMTLSNATSALVLSTGNKSELAVGYSTLYGDMVGGLAPLGDLTKQQVYAIARRLNECPHVIGLGTPPIPPASIDKAPSAELRPGQLDQDSLPPYDMLDAIVEGWVDEERTVEEIATRNAFDVTVVQRWTRAIDAAQYKRFQAPLILKVSARAFGPGRRMPLAMRWTPDVR
jgi:NAD+ synthetase